MISSFDPTGTGLGGPGMWDPMPLTPPVRPPAEVEEQQFLWSRPESDAATPENPSAPPAAAAKKKPVKKAAKKKPAKKAAKKKPAKKAAKKKPVKKAAKKAKKRR